MNILNDVQLASSTVDAFNELRSRVYDLMRSNNGLLMGSDAWLRNAVCESDLQLSIGSDTVQVYGSCRSSQTQDVEYFDFSFPFSELAS